MMYAVVWVPDWPLVALAMNGHDLSRPTVVMGARGVVACNGAARDVGVRRGMRSRHVQSLSEDLVILRQDEGVEVRAFERVAQVVGDCVPSVSILRPGLVTFLARGAIRAHGGSAQLAQQIIGDIAMSIGVEAHVGFAPGLFGAVLAARADLEIAELAPFLDAQPIESLLLGCFTRQIRQRVAVFIDSARHLGMTKIGDVRRLDRRAFVSRFGVVAHDVISLIEGTENGGAAKEHEQRSVTIEREPDHPLMTVDQAAFLARDIAREVSDELTHLGVISTEIMIDVTMEDGTSRQRSWTLDTTAQRDITDRLRWQLAAWLSEDDDGLGSGMSRLMISASGLLPAGHAQSTLWGTHEGHDEAARRAVSRIQSLLGEDAVLVPAFIGGREPAEAYVLEPWDAHTTGHSEAPWPGALPQPWPVAVYEEPREIQLRDLFGHECQVSGLGTFFCQYTCADPRPAKITIDKHTLTIKECAGPWLHANGWWNPATEQRRAWCEAIDDHGRGFLLYRDAGSWWLRGAYS